MRSTWLSREYEKSKNIEVIKDDALNFSDHYPILLDIIDN